VATHTRMAAQALAALPQWRASKREPCGVVPARNLQAPAFHRKGADSITRRIWLASQS